MGETQKGEGGGLGDKLSAAKEAIASKISGIKDAVADKLPGGGGEEEDRPTSAPEEQATGGADTPGVGEVPTTGQTDDTGGGTPERGAAEPRPVPPRPTS